MLRGIHCGVPIGSGTNTISMYALAAQRHMYEFGTTSEQLAAVRVTASHHAQHNPHALLKNPVTIEEVLASPVLSDPKTTVPRANPAFS